MRRTAIKKMGKKGDEWTKARKILVAAYGDVCITHCELNIVGYHSGFALAFAHGRKRGDLVDDELYTFVVLACQGCHDHIEYDVGHDEMARIVRETIDKRVVQPVIKVEGKIIWQ